MTENNDNGKDMTGILNPEEREGHAAIDDDTYEYLQALSDVPDEEPHLTDFANTGKGGGEAVGQIEQWLPDEESWAGKTYLHYSQATPAAVTSEYRRLLPLLSDELHDIIDSVRSEYMEAVTSIDGDSREDQVEVLSPVFRDAYGGGMRDMVKGGVAGFADQNPRGEGGERR